MQGTNILCHNAGDFKAGLILMAGNCEDGNYTEITDQILAEEDYCRYALCWRVDVYEPRPGNPVLWYFFRREERKQLHQ